MRHLSTFLVGLAGLGLVGCAEVHAPAPQLGGLSTPTSVTPALPSVDGVAGLHPVEEQEDDAEWEQLEADLGYVRPTDDPSLGEDPDVIDWQPPVDPLSPEAQVKSPLADLSQTELQRRVKEDLASLGPLSIGAPNRGRLINGLRMPDGDRWRLTDPGNAYGTQETVDNLVKAIDKVHAQFPDSQKLIIGHISAKNGGWLRPHKSHQAGRDVDISYFYTGEKAWYVAANDKNLDKARTWAFVKALLTETPVEMILIDTSIQKLLREYALSKGEDAEFVDRVFQYGGKSKRPMIRHVKGHATHIHIRFYSPVAQASARVAAAYLPRPAPAKHESVAAKKTASSTNAKKGAQPKEEESFVLHKARSGDTLDSLARRYGTTVQAIKAANNLRDNRIKDKRTYRIPRKVASASPAPTKGARRR